MISIIIPFYNVENYIEKCILSVQSQTYGNFECILVDDGSLDQTYNRALQTIGDDTRFRIVRQYNKGLGGARNTGIEAAKGEYIVFLDSDDYWSADFLERMYDELIEHDVDVVVCLVKYIDEAGNVFKLKKIPKRLVDETEKIQRVLLNRPSACNKLFKRKVWEHIRFPEYLYFEDLATMYQLAPYIHNMLLTDVVCLNYVKRSDSITNTCSSKHVQDMIQVYTTINRNLPREFFSKAYIAKALIRLVLQSHDG